MEPAGTLIEGKYEILAKIREGGMGSIYRVRHRLLDEVRAIKVIRPQQQADRELKRRFTEEAKTATRLKHPNIATIYDFAVEEDGTAYLVMEFIEGSSLADLLASQALLSIPLTLEIAHQTLSALGYLHRKNVVHRDIAPDNLMLTRDEEEQPRVKLIDLGIAKALDRPADMTSTGMFLGKLKYASPEQYGALAPGEKLDGRSDLYGFGVVLYELLTGSRPFVAETPAELLRAHLSQPPLPFSESDPEGRIPPDLREAILKALEKKRENRFASAEEFDRALAPLRSRFPLVGSLDPTLIIPSAPRFTPTSPPPPVTPGVQDRLDRRFGGETGLKRTPLPIPAVSEDRAKARAEVTRPQGCTVRVAVQFAAAIAATAIAALLIVRSRSERPTVVATAAVQTPGVARPAPLETPEVRIAARMHTAAPAPPTVVAEEPTPLLSPLPEPSQTPLPEPSPSPAERPTETRARTSPEGDNRRLRAAADAAQTRSMDARVRAEAAGAPKFATAFFEGGRAQEEEARRLLAQGNLSGASAAFALAARQYESSESAARIAPRPSPTQTPKWPRSAAERSALLARERCSQARMEAEEAGAANLAEQVYGAGRKGQLTAEGLMRRADFIGAGESFEGAARDYQRARSMALASRSQAGGSRLALEQSRIRETIRLAERAQTNLDVELYLRVFPSLDRRRLEVAFSKLRSQSLAIEILSIAISPDGSRATARIYEKRLTVPRKGSSRRSEGERVLSLEKRGEQWVIARTSQD